MRENIFKEYYKTMAKIINYKDNRHGQRDKLCKGRVFEPQRDGNKGGCDNGQQVYGGEVCEIAESPIAKDKKDWPDNLTAPFVPFAV